MLEFIMLWKLAKRIGQIVTQKGHRKFLFQVMAICLWFVGELIGAVGGTLTGAVLFGLQTPSWFIYLNALCGGVIAACFTFMIMNEVPDRTVSGVEQTATSLV